MIEDRIKQKNKTAGGLEAALAALGRAAGKTTVPTGGTFVAPQDTAVAVAVAANVPVSDIGLCWLCVVVIALIYLNCDHTYKPFIFSTFDYPNPCTNFAYKYLQHSISDTLGCGEARRILHG